jgi:hypothetical protein
MIRARSLSFVLAFTLVGAAACGDDDDGGTGVDPLAQLVGSYTVQSMVYEADADSNVRFDLIPAGFGIQSFNITAAGTFTGQLLLPGVEDAIPLTGTLAVTSNTIAVDFTGASAQALEDLTVTFTLQGDILSWFTDDVTFDFTLADGQDNPIPANLTVVMVRT